MKVERDDDCQRDDGQVHGHAEPGEKSALVGAVIAGV